VHLIPLLLERGFDAVFRAAAPVGASLLYAASGGYGSVLVVLATLCLLAAGAVLLAGDTPVSLPDSTGER
jgi:hypothetical protein